MSKDAKESQLSFKIGERKKEFLTLGKDEKLTKNYPGLSLHFKNLKGSVFWVTGLEADYKFYNYKYGFYNHYYKLYIDEFFFLGEEAEIRGTADENADKNYDSFFDEHQKIAEIHFFKKVRLEGKLRITNHEYLRKIVFTGKNDLDMCSVIITKNRCLTELQFGNAELRLAELVLARTTFFQEMTIPKNLILSDGGLTIKENRNLHTLKLDDGVKLPRLVLHDNPLLKNVQCGINVSINTLVLYKIPLLTNFQNSDNLSINTLCLQEFSPKSIAALFDGLSVKKIEIRKSLNPPASTEKSNNQSNNDNNCKKTLQNKNPVTGITAPDLFLVLLL